MTHQQDATVLGVGPNASAAEIKAAYREKAMTLHPDRGGNAGAFAVLSAAYDRLLDVAMKRESVCQECSGRGYVEVPAGFYPVRRACPRCKLVRRA